MHCCRPRRPACRMYASGAQSRGLGGAVRSVHTRARLFEGTLVTDWSALEGRSASPWPAKSLLTLLDGWINRRQLETIDYLKEESRSTPSIHRCRTRRLARRAYALGRRALSELDTLITPDTLMRWYRTLVAQKWTYTHRRGPGRPRTIQVITQLIIRMALENRSWGYTRIQGALANLGHDVGRGTIANVLSEHGIDPVPDRGKRTSWSTFLKAQWDSIAAQTSSRSRSSRCGT
jgi:hypothetical protein